jgi:hypothetical protein
MVVVVMSLSACELQSDVANRDEPTTPKKCTETHVLTVPNEGLFWADI